MGLSEHETAGDRAAPAKRPIPWWGWAFAVGCALIPALTIGGAIPGALGGGGAFGCIAAARHATLSITARVMTCAAIFVGCRVLFMVFIVVVSVLQARSTGT